MKFTAIILAITCLVAFASANDKGPNGGALTYQDVVNECVKACGKGPHCKHYCACVVSKMDNLECTTEECKKKPKGCDKYNNKRAEDIQDMSENDQDTPENADQATSEPVEIHPENINYNQDAPESDVGDVMAGDAGGNTCATEGCDAGLPYCLQQCGSGPQCEGYCACYLHSNPKSVCRQQGCVEAPQGCDRWEFTDHDNALAGPETDDFERVAAAAVAQEGTDDDGDQCEACRDAGYECSKSCGNDMTCKNACLCTSTPGDSCVKCKSAGCPQS